MLTSFASLTITKRGLPRPGEPLKPYDLSIARLQDKAAKRFAEGRLEKAASSEEKAYILQSEDTEQMRAVALGNFVKHNDKSLDLVDATRRKAAASNNRRAYRSLVHNLRKGERVANLSEDSVRTSIQNAYCTYMETEPEKSWQKKAVEAAQIAKSSAEYFDLVKANQDRQKAQEEVAASTSSSSASDASRLIQLTDDMFKAVLERDEEAAKRVALYHKEVMIKADDDMDQLNKEYYYYQQKRIAWDDVAASIEARRRLGN